jgi:hypothetical protein
MTYLESLIGMRDCAIANFQRALSLSGNDINRKLLHAGPGGKTYTPSQVLQEMKADPPTQEGISLLKIWCMSDEQVTKEIEKAKLTLTASRQ